MASYWSFLVGPTTANVPSRPRGVGERPSSSRFFPNGQSRFIGSENRWHGIR
jgi:hypothetical protein